MILLNGKFVKPEEIDSRKHKFIGIFRTPKPPHFPGAEVYLCDCGQSLWTVESVFEHWNLGHFDSPQYIDI